MHQIPKPILEKFFSKTRLEKYQNLADLAGQNSDFLKLYQNNSKYSEKFFTALSQFEVILRNAVNEQLIQDFGEDWFEEKCFNFSVRQKDMIRACFQTQRVSILPKFCATFWQNFAAVSGIQKKFLPKNEPKFGQKRNVVGLKTGSNEAKMRLLGKKKEINSCNITSNLSFGFWINLFSSDYDKILWRSSLYKIFYTTKAKPGRGKLRERLEKFLILRNRISHCECIVHFPLQKYHLQLIEVIGWINSDIAKWLELETNLQNL